MKYEITTDRERPIDRPADISTDQPTNRQTDREFLLPIRRDSVLILCLHSCISNNTKPKSYFTIQKRYIYTYIFYEKILFFIHSFRRFRSGPRGRYILDARHQ